MNSIRSLSWSKVKYVLKGMFVGAIAGTIVSAFRMFIYMLQDFMPIVYDFLSENKSWIIAWVIFLFIVASTVIWMMREEPHIQGNGVAELKGQLQGTLNLNWFTIFWRKFISSTLVLGLGIPVGQEGPSIQIGGVIGQGLNKFLKGNKSQENIFISSGAAAGLAAAFNAPLSAFVLVLEEIHHRFSNVLILSVFSASITASFVAFTIFGSEAAIGLGPTAIFPLEQYFYLVGLGALLAVGGWIFQRGIFVTMPKLYKKLPIPRYLHGYIPFILILFIGFFWVSMLGGGTDVITTLATQRFSTQILLVVLIFRFLAFQVSYGTGIPAGSLVPSLAFGALLGAIYGNIIIDMTGLDNEFVRNFLIYGMGGFFTATTKAPVTGIILITELTGSMNHMMPISIVCLSAYVVSDMLNIEATDEITLRNKTSHYPTVFKGKVASLDITVDFNDSFDHRELDEIDLPYNSKISKIKREENEFLPHKDIVLLPGDVLTITCDEGFLTQVSNYFEEKNKSR